MDNGRDRGLGGSKLGDGVVAIGAVAGPKVGFGDWERNMGDVDKEWEGEEGEEKEEEEEKDEEEGEEEEFKGEGERVRKDIFFYI